MTAVAPAEAAALLPELRRLCERLPVPSPTWHPHVAAIAACRADLERAIGLAAARPETLSLLAELLDGDEAPAFDGTRSPWLRAAWERLEALPIPEGQHPYLDDILPALEALRLLLVALGRTTGSGEAAAA